MRVLLVALGVVAVLLLALWMLLPLVFYSLLTAVLSVVLQAFAPLANAVSPAPEQRLRVEVGIVVDGREYRAAAVTSCRSQFEVYGPEHATFGRRPRLNGGYVTVDLPDGRVVQSSAIDSCSEKEVAERVDELSFYLIDRRHAPARAWATSADRSKANAAAAFRVAVLSIGPTTEAPTDPAHRSALPSDIRGPRAIEDIQTRLTSYVALAIPKPVWSDDAALRAQLSAVSSFRAVPRPGRDALVQLIGRTDAWPNSAAPSSDLTRIDLPRPDAPPVAIEYLALAPSASGGPRQAPVPRVCISEQECVAFPVTGTEAERVHSREGYFFDPIAQNLIAVRAFFAGAVAVTAVNFAP